MASLTIEIPDEHLTALEARATQEGSTIEELVAGLVANSVAEAGIGWEAREVLQLFDDAVPGLTFGGQTLLLKWGTKPRDAFWKGYDELKAAGLLEEPNPSSIALTERGYRLLQDM